VLSEIEQIQASAFISVQQAAAILGVHEDTFYKWVRRGKVPAYGPPNSVRVKLPEVIEALRYRPGSPERRRPRPPAPAAKPSVTDSPSTEKDCA
jgi:excisionase family DNA binding protein